MLRARAIGTLLLIAAACGGPPPEPVDPLPGAPPFPPALARQLAGAARRRGPEVDPHTSLLRPDGTPRYTNRLILESGAYLLQHAHNPVNWYPWGDEAFAEARRLNRPVLLSIGYATCHWCHVMAAESFDDEEIASLINSRYVAVKVDREERPDVDGVYLAAVQRLGNGGGWPMTVWLTPDRRPFFAGTYFPPRDGMRGMRQGLVGLLARLADAYDADPAAVASKAAQVAAEVASSAAPSGGDLPGAGPIRAAVEELRGSFDAEWGGFGGAPKFPRPSELELLLRYHRRTGEPDALSMVTTTLERIAAGGIHDQLGGGFHRYATDPRWRVPHFEKLLADNALLSVVYLEAFQATGRTDFADVARTTLDYLARDLAAPGGGFFAGTDADSAGEEGAAFIWTAQQIDAAVGPERGRLLAAYYGIGGEEGAALALPPSVDEVAAAAGVTAEDMARVVEEARAPLLAARARRPAPAIDRNVLVDWNALAISAFARGALVLGDQRYLQVARGTADYLLSRGLVGGRLAHAVGAQSTLGDGFLDDHAFLIAALLDLFEVDSDRRWARAAVELQGALDARFVDARTGGYFFAGAGREALLARAEPDYDGAVPSGNSVAALDLLRIADLTGDDRYRARADAVLRAFAGVLGAEPIALPRMLVALDYRLDRPRQIVLVTPEGGDSRPFLDRLRNTFVPNRVLVTAVGYASTRALGDVVPVVAEKTPLGGRSTAYVCEAQRCELPTTDPAIFERQVTKIVPLP
jgi:uncharacterized protein YyaL (SSP411 family)